MKAFASLYYYVRIVAAYLGDKVRLQIEAGDHGTCRTQGRGSQRPELLRTIRDVRNPLSLTHISF
jgi:hypothetical protein